MYELIKLSEKCYYFDCPSKIGLIKIKDDEVILIDSGNDKSAGKKVLKTLNENGFTLKAIFNTHSHADHIGGNKYLQEQTGCKIYAPGIECDFTNHPVLEPAFLLGGYPLKDLHHKFLLAEESNALPLSEAVLPEGLEIIHLPGHSYDMVGFKSDDGIVFLADCLSSEETIDKYGVSFIYDVKSYIETLEMVKSMEAKLFVPSHAAVCENIAALADYNIKSVKGICEAICRICKEPCTFEEVLQQLFAAYSMNMNIQQYALIGSSLRSYIAYLSGEGLLGHTIENNRVLWKTV